MKLTRSNLDALNAAGEALRSLGMGAIRLRYRPADHLIPRDGFNLTLDAGEISREIVGTGPTPEAALFDALAKRDSERKAA